MTYKEETRRDREARGRAVTKLYGTKSLVVKVPFHFEHAEAKVIVAKLLEEADRHVEIRILATGGAIVSDNRCSSLAVGLVGDGQRLAAELRLLARVTVLLLVKSDNEVIITVDLAASTRNAVLSEPGSPNERSKTIENDG
jgi:hypothetical protein